MEMELEMAQWEWERREGYKNYLDPCEHAPILNENAWIINLIYVYFDISIAICSMSIVAIHLRSDYLDWREGQSICTYFSFGHSFFKLNTYKYLHMDNCI